MLSIIRVFVIATAGLFCTAWCPAQDDLLTVAESSNFTATSRFVEVAAFVDQCDARAEHIQRVDFGSSVEGRPMISVVVANPAFDFENPDDRLRVLVIGNIHSGECAGKEGLLMMLRDLAAVPDHAWLSRAVIVVAPNYNVDANERIGVNHRRSQVGPSAGMGLRENPQGLDLNRDFVKLESPEARSLVSLIDRFDPHLFIDCHTTNGSRHRYVLTYDIPHNPSTPQSIRDFLRNRMMPAVTQTLEAKSVPTFYYGNFGQDNTVWTTYGHEPRYSTEYVGLRGRLAILSEAYSYASYKDRIMASKAFVEQCIQFVCDNADDVKKLLADAQQDQITVGTARPNQVILHIDSAVAPFDEKVIVRGYEGEAPKDYEVTFWGDYKPVISVEMPFCYLIPKEMSRAADRLAMHGIQIEELKSDSDLHVEINKITKAEKSPRAFQNHNMVRLETESRIETRKIEARTFVVRTAQPLGRLASYLLEPESNDGLATWNFFDQWISENAEFPVLQVRSPIELDTEVLESVPANGKLRLADIFGPKKVPLAGTPVEGLEWGKGGKYYTLKNNGRPVRIEAASGARVQPDRVASRQELSRALSELDLSESLQRELAGSGLEKETDGQHLFILPNNEVTIVYDADTQKATRLGTDEDPAELAKANPSGNHVAFVQGGNLKVFDGNQVTDITTDDGQEILNGKLDWVYQEELYGRGNFYGYWWSPQSNAIAFLRLDESPVQRYTVSDHIPVRGHDEITPYPKAGDPLPEVSLGIYTLTTQQTTWANLDDYDRDSLLISRVAWSPNGQVHVQLQNRQQTWLDLSTVDVGSGVLTRLFRDETPAWIRSPGDPVWLTDGTFLWLSPRTGFNQIYHYDSSGKQIYQVTDEPWEVRSLLGVAPDDRTVFFTACPDSPVRVQAMSSTVKGDNLRRITDGMGTHDVDFNDDFTYLFDHYSTITEPLRTRLCTADGAVVRVIDPNLSDYLKYFELSQPEFVKVPLPDGAGDLDGVMLKPPGFDPQKKYPVLVHVYSGPQAPRVRDRFMGTSYLWHQFMAQQGYIIWMCDNRSASYAAINRAWPIHRDLGKHELADIEIGLDWLKQNVWVDATRIGIWGWSYGGYMTAFAMTHSTSFKAGISGAPVTDWKNYDAIYTERYMDTPQNNPTGYESSSVLAAAGNLHGRMLLIHGTIDDNVHMSNSMQLAYELQKAGKQFNLMVYPKNRHGVRQPDQQLHLYQMMTEFLLNNL